MAEIPGSRGGDGGESNYLKPVCSRPSPCARSEFSPVFPSDVSNAVRHCSPAWWSEWWSDLILERVTSTPGETWVNALLHPVSLVLARQRDFGMGCAASFLREMEVGEHQEAADASSRGHARS